MSTKEIFRHIDREYNIIILLSSLSFGQSIAITLRYEAGRILIILYSGIYIVVSTSIIVPCLHDIRRGVLRSTSCNSCNVPWADVVEIAYR